MGSIQSVQERINAFFAGEVELNEPLLRDTPKQDSGMNLRMSMDKDLLAEGHPWRELRLEFWYEQYQRAYDQGWARNSEKIYTKKDCFEYNIDVPTHDILNYLNEKLKLDLRGKIVNQDGCIYDAEHVRTVKLASNRATSIKDFSSTMMDFHDIREKTELLQEKVQVSNSIRLTNSDTYQNGTYLYNRTMRDSNSNIFKMCDNPHCLKTCSIALNLGAHDLFRNKTFSDSIVDFISTRKIYTLDRKEEGDFDLCQLCLVSEVTKQLQNYKRNN